MRTHTTYDSDKLLCILRSVSPTCDNNEADPYDKIAEKRREVAA